MCWLADIEWWLNGEQKPNLVREKYLRVEFWTDLAVEVPKVATQNEFCYL